MKVFFTAFFLFVFAINLVAEPAVKYFEFAMKSDELIQFSDIKESKKDSMIVQTLSNETKTVSLWDIQKITKYKDPASNGVDVGVKWILPVAIPVAFVAGLAGSLVSAIGSNKQAAGEAIGVGLLGGGLYGFGIGYLIGFCIPQEETDLSQVNEISQKKEMILKIISSSTQN